MDNNKFEKVIYTLLRVLGVVAILGAYLCDSSLYAKQNILVLNHTAIIGNVYMISPAVIIAMIVTIALYLVFIKIVEKHISISKKASDKDTGRQF